MLVYVISDTQLSLRYDHSNLYVRRRRVTEVVLQAEDSPPNTVLFQVGTQRDSYRM
jgi:hypothetical protein